jgi:hypothetical protein
VRALTVSGTSAVVYGLRNGVPYRFTVAARNALGTGPRSRFTNTVKPTARLVWPFWCTVLPMDTLPMSTMRVAALGTSSPWSGEILLRGVHSAQRQRPHP